MDITIFIYPYPILPITGILVVLRHAGFYLGSLTIIAANIAQPILERRRLAKI